MTVVYVFSIEFMYSITVDQTNVYFVPTVEGAKVPGISFSIKHFALHPVQCPGKSTFGCNLARSRTVSFIRGASASARWNPPIALCNFASPPNSRASVTVLIIPAWPQPVKTTRPRSTCSS
jgi:hypothetical protein